MYMSGTSAVLECIRYWCSIDVVLPGLLRLNSELNILLWPGSDVAVLAVLLRPCNMSHKWSMSHGPWRIVTNSRIKLKSARTERLTKVEPWLIGWSKPRISFIISIWASVSYNLLNYFSSTFFLNYILAHLNASFI